MSKYQRNPFLSLQPRATQLDEETPEYLVPVLATYDNLDEAAKRERATILYCQGHRTAEIAVTLQVPVSTVSSWLKDARYLLASELRAGREEHLLRAIESARALAAEAWTAYERECQLQRDILAGRYDRLRRRVMRPGRAPQAAPRRHATTVISAPSARVETPTWTASDDDTSADDTDDDSSSDILYEEFERPRFTSQAARLLAVALAAQREVARLQGLYEHLPPPPQPVDFQIHGPLPEDAAPVGATASIPPDSAPAPTTAPDQEALTSEPTAPTHGHTGPAAGIQPANPSSDTARSVRDALPSSSQSPNIP